MSTPSKNQLSTEDMAKITRNLKEAKKMPRLEFLNWPTRFMSHLKDVAVGLSVPYEGLVFGILIPLVFAMSYAKVQLENSDWIEQCLIWIILHMASGTRKTAIYQFVQAILLELDP